MVPSGQEFPKTSSCPSSLRRLLVTGKASPRSGRVETGLWSEVESEGSRLRAAGRGDRRPSAESIPLRAHPWVREIAGSGSQEERDRRGARCRSWAALRDSAVLQPFDLPAHPSAFRLGLLGPLLGLSGPFL